MAPVPLLSQTFAAVKSPLAREAPFMCVWAGAIVIEVLRWQVVQVDVPPVWNDSSCAVVLVAFRLCRPLDGWAAVAVFAPPLVWHIRQVEVPGVSYQSKVVVVLWLLWQSMPAQVPSVPLPGVYTAAVPPSAVEG